MDAVQGVSAIAVIAAVTTAVLTLRDRHRPGPALPVAAMLLLAAVWTTIGLLFGAVDGTGAKVAVFRLIFPIGGLLAAAVLWHAAVLTGRLVWLVRRRLMLLVVEPAAMAIAALTDPAYHHLVTDARVSGDAILLGFGPLAWVHIVWCLAMVGLAVAWMLAAMRDAIPAHRARYAVALLALGLPLIGAILSVRSASRAGASDLTGALSVVTAAVWWWTGRHGSATIGVPISVGQVLSALGDAILVIDPRGCVVQANPAAHDLVRMFGSTNAGRVEGVHWTTVVSAGTAEQIRSRNQLVTCQGRVFDVRLTEVQASGRPNGTVVVLRDVTDVERLRADLADQATRDGLTGLRNRRHLDQVADVMVAEAHRLDAPLVAMMVDIDHFKRVNDVHGHVVGDVVLQAVARELVALSRSDDVWVRFGGEEFVALLPGATASQVLDRAEDLCRRCRGLRVPVAGGEVAVTVSIGLVELAPGESLDEVLDAADSALYEAKAAGRDRVAVGGRRGDLASSVAGLAIGWRRAVQ